MSKKSNTQQLPAGTAKPQPTAVYDCEFPSGGRLTMNVYPKPGGGIEVVLSGYKPNGEKAWTREFDNREGGQS